MLLVFLASLWASIKTYLLTENHKVWVRSSAECCQWKCKLLHTHSTWSQLRSTGYGSFRMRMSESYSDGCSLWATMLATITESIMGKRKLIWPVNSNTIMAVEMVWVAAPDIAAAPTRKQKEKYTMLQFTRQEPWPSVHAHYSFIWFVTCYSIASRY